MTATGDPTLAQLMAAIVANPDEDTPRLEYADRLQELGDDDRAEFIRVQVELANGDPCDAEKMPDRHEVSDPGACDWCDLRRRELELLAAHPEWSRCECDRCQRVVGSYKRMAYHRGPNSRWDVCETCDGSGDLFRFSVGTVSGTAAEPKVIYTGRKLTWDRGFIGGIELRSTEVWGHQPDHHGFDRVGPDVGVDWSGRNGFACTCRWSSRSHGDECPEHGKIGSPIPEWEPTRLLLALVRQVPTLLRVAVAGRVPYHNAADCFLWSNEATRHAPSDLSQIPTAIFDLLEGDVDIRNRRVWRTYRTRAAAHDALALAIVRWARKAVPA